MTFGLSADFLDRVGLFCLRGGQVPATPNTFVPYAIMAFIAWRVIYRVRRNFGKQRVRHKRLVTRIVIYSVLTVFISLAGILKPMVLEGLGGGLVGGVVLALVGLRLTKFEITAEGIFYTPNPYIGVAVSLLFIFRLFYRIIAVSGASGHAASQNPAAMLSPLTFGVFGLLAGYYVAYFAGILIESGKLSKAKT